MLPLKLLIKLVRGKHLHSIWQPLMHCSVTNSPTSSKSSERVWLRTGGSRWLTPVPLVFLLFLLFSVSYYWYRLKLREKLLLFFREVLFLLTQPSSSCYSAAVCRGSLNQIITKQCLFFFLCFFWHLWQACCQRPFFLLKIQSKGFKWIYSNYLLPHVQPRLKFPHLRQVSAADCRCF